ncbi:LacI family DNA-binding transcriptional regulator [Paenibacillus sp. HN-1]|uniref:LacI family DNA-binding transcriptional regulator n=1 Tax=Paenibacillus TaxID=44249 RepID=UPI001CA8887A|nr:MULTISPECIES: LacI family DNA-binding transcriptional regulator [Paenibacillus]MBY9081151.1 LacI family DNA-binding transcriptional regulator [Paenibacillus sp. CGMCC 1.18879]MBY9087188.1 LacI family DNA-binding transcriptional regulator [Paenibacillus sinensis]
MNPTIKDVAKRANVSIATVSRVLNNLGGYSDKTREKVMQVIHETGYRPNAVARGLINKRTRTIGVLFPRVSSSFSSGILQGIEEYAHIHDYSIMICNTGGDGNRTLKVLELLQEKQVDGVIFCSSALKTEYVEIMAGMRVPIVLVSSESSYANIPFVRIDNYTAAFEAVEYLIGKGHRNIAMIGGRQEDQLAGVPRLEGYLGALRKHHIPVDERRIIYGDFRYESGYKGFEALLESARDITAIFAASDEMALGALSAAYKHGIRVPDDISVIGFDGLELSRMAVPPLTTVQQPLVEMGSLAFELILEMIESGEIPEQANIVHHSIIERDSVRAVVD